MEAIQEIQKERAKQISKGFDAAHDDKHLAGEIADAAIQIIANVVGCRVQFNRSVEDWTGDLAEKVCASYGDKKALIIAAAMLVAEIDRLERSGVSNY